LLEIICSHISNRFMVIMFSDRCRCCVTS